MTRKELFELQKEFLNEWFDEREFVAFPEIPLEKYICWLEDKIIELRNKIAD